jgi:hypothetical protein
MFHPPSPKPSSDAIVMANRMPMLKFYSTPINRKFRNSIRNSIVLHDEQGLGPIFLQTHLQKLFPIQGWSWVARSLPQQKFLIEPLNED